MIRRFEEPHVAGVKYTYRPGVYVILPRDGMLLLTHQVLAKSELQLPGGGIDPGESPVQALHREVYEETGWRVTNARRLGAYRRFTYMPEYDMWAEKLCMIYTAMPVRRLGPPTEGDHTALWATPAIAAQELTNEGDRHFVKALWGLV